jgi:hypothetical protein
LMVRASCRFFPLFAISSAFRRCMFPPNRNSVGKLIDHPVLQNRCLCFRANISITLLLNKRSSLFFFSADRAVFALEQTVQSHLGFKLRSSRFA